MMTTTMMMHHQCRIGSAILLRVPQSVAAGGGCRVRRSATQTTTTSSHANSSSHATTSTTTTTTNTTTTTFFQWYSHCLDHHPIPTKCITSALVAATGDCLCQRLQNEPSWDRWRTSRFFTLGFCMAGPGGHVWYGILSRYLPGSSFLAVSRRVFADQLLYNPIYMWIWLSSYWYMEDSQQFSSLSVYVDKMAVHFPDIICANWTLWFPAQAFNFRFVPMPFQVLYTDCFDLLWSAYLSFSTSEMTRREQEEAARSGIVVPTVDHSGGGREPAVLVHRKTTIYPRHHR
jgi:hypothetical protein